MQAVDFVNALVLAQVKSLLGNPGRMLVDVGEDVDEVFTAQTGWSQGLKTAHFELSLDGSCSGWVACQCLAMSTRRAHQTFSWLCTYSRKRASDARRAGRPSRRQCMPIESIFGAPATPSA